jgi:hypothetical protein
MMTVKEAKQRMQVNRAAMKRTGHGLEVKVWLNEWTKQQIEDRAYFTDDLEDAVLTAGRMRLAQITPAVF